jgi:hypothetical protein
LAREIMAAIEKVLLAALVPICLLALLLGVSICILNANVLQRTLFGARR